MSAYNAVWLSWKLVQWEPPLVCWKTCKKFCRVFQFLIRFKKISIWDFHKSILNDCEFRENRHSESRRKWSLSVLTACVFRFRWNSVSGDVRILLFDIYEFRENRRSEDRTFLTVVNEVTFTCVCRETVWHFEVKNAVVKSVCFVTLCTSCSLVKTGRFIFQWRGLHFSPLFSSLMCCVGCCVCTPPSFLQSARMEHCH